MQQIITAANIFTGTEWLHNHNIVIENGIIKDLAVQSGNNATDIPADAFIAPAFIDFQVYGAGGKLFSLYPTASTLQTMYEVFSKEGTCLFQPTLATNTISVFKQGIDAVKKYWSDGGRGVAGLHLEGPWIHPDKRGAHIKEFIQVPTVKDVEEILLYGKGVIKTVTIAPEVCSSDIMELLLAYDVIISAGHSNAGYEEAMKSFGNGVSTVTHLYNAMSGLHHREPGMVGAVFEDEAVLASIVPDGYHVDFAAIRIAKKLMGKRLFAITDAVTPTTDGPYQHYFTNGKYECNGTLSGSALSMYKAFYNLVQEVGIEIEEALRMCSLFPAKALKKDDLYGKIAPGYAAHFVVLNKRLDLLKTISNQAAQRK